MKAPASRKLGTGVDLSQTPNGVEDLEPVSPIVNALAFSLPFPEWALGALASGLIALAYLAIAFHVFSGLLKSHQSLANPLALATASIFFSCGIGHGLHLVHILLPFVGVDVALGMATRYSFSDWHVWAWEGVTASIALWYWSLRNRFPALVRGSALFEDIRMRQAQALEIHDNVVQELARAKLALELGRDSEGLESLDASLRASRRIITDLLGNDDEQLRTGALKRRTSAGDPP